MLQAVRVKGLRSLRDVEAPLAPLTVLVGPNGAGKSNILRALSLASVLTQKLLSEPQLDQERIPPWPYEIRHTFPVAALDFQEIHAGQQQLDVEIGVDFGAVTVDVLLRQGRERSQAEVSVWAADDIFVYLDQLAGLLFITADRTAPVPQGQTDDTLDMAAVNVTPRWLIAQLGRIAVQDDAARLFVQMGSDLVGLDWTRLLTHPERLEYGERVASLSGTRSARLPLRFASLGTQQALAVIAAVLGADAGAVLLTEEPEISLHPRAQVRLGEFLAEHAPGAAHKQVIFTTHSHYLLHGVCKAVRDGKAHAGSVLVLDCGKDVAGTQVRPIRVDDKGHIDGWIPTFTDVDNYLFQGWIDGMRGEGGP